MRLLTTILFMTMLMEAGAQTYGFVVTDQDSLFKGFVTMTLEGSNGRKIKMMGGRHGRVRSFYTRDLKFYSYKKDTFAILNAFYPFEGEEYLAQYIEAKVLVSKGRLKLYWATFPDYGKDFQKLSDGNGHYINVMTSGYTTYVIKDREGNLYGVKKGNDEFLKSVEVVLADHTELIDRIKKKELKYKDMEEIIRLYNAAVKKKPVLSE